MQVDSEDVGCGRDFRRNGREIRMLSATAARGRVQVDSEDVGQEVNEAAVGTSGATAGRSACFICVAITGAPSATAAITKGVQRQERRTTVVCAKKEPTETWGSIKVWALYRSRRDEEKHCATRHVRRRRLGTRVLEKTLNNVQRPIH